MTILDEHPALILFQELLAVPSPSGREHKLTAIIQNMLQKWGFDPEIDGAGNLIVRLPGSSPDGPHLLYGAHMDEIGFTVTHILPDGSLRAIRSGGLLPWKAGESPVEILAADDSLIPGVLSFGSTHAAGSLEREAQSWENTRIITGLTPAELDAAGVFPGAAGTLARHVCRPVVLGTGPDPLIAAWTFDDRLGCVMLLRLLQTLQESGRQPLSPTTIAFTTREEVGGYGAAFLAQREKPDVFVAVDGSPLTPDVDLKLDGRPVAWAKDRLGPYDHQLILDFQAAGKRVGTEIQTGAYSTNASDASMAMRAGGVGRIACFGHARENSHGFEIIRLSSLDHIERTLVEFVTTWNGA